MMPSGNSLAKSSRPSRAELIARRLAGATCVRCLYLAPGEEAGFSASVIEVRHRQP
jgi:hypothetical protein